MATQSESSSNVGGICALLLFAVIILIIIYFYSNRRNSVQQVEVVKENFNSTAEEEGVQGDLQEAGDLAVQSSDLRGIGNMGGDTYANTHENMSTRENMNHNSNQENMNSSAPAVHTQQGNLSTDPSLKNQRQAGCFPKEQLNPEELLPQDNANVWAKVNPSGEGTLKDRNFLQAGHHIGVNTVGQTLRNANMQLRSEPPNPQVKVSPWLQTTIEPDVNRKPMEIGGCA